MQNDYLKDLDSLSLSDLKQFNPEKTLIFFVISPIQGEKDLFLDLNSSKALAQSVAEKMQMTSILFPPLPFSRDGIYPFHLKVRAHVLRDALIDLTKSLMNQGFLYFIVCCQFKSPKTLTAIEDACKMINFSRLFFRKGFLISASSALTDWKTCLRHPLKLNHHDPNFNEEDVTKIVFHLTSLIQGEKIRSQFRSWYSIIPLNKSFFLAWVLTLLIITLFFTWAYLLIL